MPQLLLSLLILLPAAALAQDTKFVPLVGIPFVDTSTDLTLGNYVNGLYLAAISIAAFLAVVKIIFAGVQYMLSEVVTDKAQAKKSIYGAIIGLLIVLGAFLILNTINPNLTNLTNLDGPTLQTEGGNTNLEFQDRVAQVCETEFGCSIRNCDFFRTELLCFNWCQNRGGAHIDSGSFWQSDRCAFPNSPDNDTADQLFIDDVCGEGRAGCAVNAIDVSNQQCFATDEDGNCTAYNIENAVGTCAEDNGLGIQDPDNPEQVLCYTEL